LVARSAITRAPDMRHWANLGADSVVRGDLVVRGALEGGAYGSFVGEEELAGEESGLAFLLLVEAAGAVVGE